MENLTPLLLIIIATSVLYVWTFRFHNVLKEFEQFGLSDLTRNLIGASKISLATLLIVSVWHTSLVLIPIHYYGAFDDCCSIFSFQNW